jgi:hypothetical protein
MKIKFVPFFPLRFLPDDLMTKPRPLPPSSVGTLLAYSAHQTPSSVFSSKTRNPLKRLPSEPSPSSPSSARRSPGSTFRSSQNGRRSEGIAQRKETRTRSARIFRERWEGGLTMGTSISEKAYTAPLSEQLGVVVKFELMQRCIILGCLQTSSADEDQLALYGRKLERRPPYPHRLLKRHPLPQLEHSARLSSRPRRISFFPSLRSCFERRSRLLRLALPPVRLLALLPFSIPLLPSSLARSSN